MKSKTRTTSEKSFDSIISKISGKDILSLQQMISIKGGDNPVPDPIIVPPFPPRP